MIISHKYKFIFIKTRKTAGTSIEAYLSQFCDIDDVLTPIFPSVDIHVPRNYTGYWNLFNDFGSHISPYNYREINDKNYFKMIYQWILKNKFYNHIPSCVVKSRISPSIWNTYFKFAVERNSFDKTISHFNMVNRRNGMSLDFEKYFKYFPLCVDFSKYTDKNDNLLLDKIIPYEDLNNGLNEVFTSLGIPFNGELNVKAKSEYGDKYYKDSFFKEKKYLDFVNKGFHKEIEMFGYTI